MCLYLCVAATYYGWRLTIQRKIDGITTKKKNFWKTEWNNRANTQTPTDYNNQIQSTMEKQYGNKIFSDEFRLLLCIQYIVSTFKLWLAHITYLTHVRESILILNEIPMDFWPFVWKTKLKSIFKAEPTIQSNNNKIECEWEYYQSERMFFKERTNVRRILTNERKNRE